MKNNLLSAAAFFIAMIGVHLQVNAQVDSAVPVPASQATAQTSNGAVVPKLKISWDCGACTQNEKVIPLIEEAYVAEAKNNNLTVSDTDIADVAIIKIRQRPPGARVMFGVMAGKDRLEVRVRYKDKEHLVGDYSANIVTGLNYLSESVGKKIYASITNNGN